MRIIAVIPARAGSKGIPNKNIRLVAGKPLISYSVENAVSSALISDVVVTSDSREVEAIAKCYQVRFRKRSSKLCDDRTTLDAVVYDAIKDEQADYIVTMQPTSPTLKVNTLDRAIKYAIDNDLDTLISVVNHPHLSWKEEDGKIVPNYVERLNRQYLPKNYLETGAFVISKRNVVTESTRIGAKVGVYEISEEEAIDVDTFFDLRSVEMVLEHHKVAIVVDGNNDIGLGHIFRMMELADAFYTKPVFFYNKNKTIMGIFGDTTYSLNAYTNTTDLLDQLEDGEFDLIINDILDTDKEYISSLKKIRTLPNVVNFEDMGDGAEEADLVINALYGKKPVRHNAYAGAKYYIAPKLFSLYEPIMIKKRIENVFICFGGADPSGYTELVLNAVKDPRYREISFHFVLGRAKENYLELMKQECNNIHFYYDVSNIPELMSKCDVAITSRGRTCFELAYLGIPVLTMAQNDREALHDFASVINGFIYLGENVTENGVRQGVENLLSLTCKERQDMQSKMLKCDLKSGRNRVKSLIDSL